MLLRLIWRLVTVRRRSKRPVLCKSSEIYLGLRRGRVRTLGSTKMALTHDAQHAHAHSPQTDGALQRPAGDSPIIPGVEVRRKGRIERFLDAHPTLSSAGVKWSGLALEDYSVPALVIPRHEHVENFVHVVLRGSVRYQVSTRGKTLEFQANPGTTFILPRRTVDEVVWRGPTQQSSPLA